MPLNLNINYLDPSEVTTLLEEAFSDSPQRLNHILTVAQNVKKSAERIAKKYPQKEIDVNEAYCAALLHDVGYIEEIATTSFHPLDGANFLCEKGYQRLAELILGHSNSPEQAKLKNIAGVYASDDISAQLITYWDTQVLQGGKLVSYQDRLKEIYSRYGENSPVTKAHQLAKERIEKIHASIEDLLV